MAFVKLGLAAKEIIMNKLFLVLAIFVFATTTAFAGGPNCDRSPNAAGCRDGEADHETGQSDDSATDGNPSDSDSVNNDDDNTQGPNRPVAPSAAAAANANCDNNGFDCPPATETPDDTDDSDDTTEVVVEDIAVVDTDTNTDNGEGEEIPNVDPTTIVPGESVLYRKSDGTVIFLTRTPEGELIEEIAIVCGNGYCPPAVCLLQPGSYVINGWGEIFGLTLNNEIIVFETTEAADDAGLTFAGYECSICLLSAGIEINDGTVTAPFFRGATEYDLSLAIAAADGRDNILFRDQDAAHQIALAWTREGSPTLGTYTVSHGVQQ